MVYVFAEDLASALIGPFDDEAAARAHMAFCDEHGDAAEVKVVSESEAAELRPTIGIELTPEEDRACVMRAL